jgi:hypothetical protein
MLFIPPISLTICSQQIKTMAFSFKYEYDIVMIVIKSLDNTLLYCTYIIHPTKWYNLYTNLYTILSVKVCFLYWNTANWTGVINIQIKLRITNLIYHVSNIYRDNFMSYLSWAAGCIWWKYKIKQLCPNQLNNLQNVFYPLTNEVAKGYRNATVCPSFCPSFRPSFRNILVTTLESTSFNGFWPNLVHT